MDNSLNLFQFCYFFEKLCLYTCFRSVTTAPETNSKHSNLQTSTQGQHKLDRAVLECVVQDSDSQLREFCQCQEFHF